MKQKAYEIVVIVTQCGEDEVQAIADGSYPEAGGRAVLQLVRVHELQSPLERLQLLEENALVKRAPRLGVWQQPHALYWSVQCACTSINKYEYDDMLRRRRTNWFSYSD